MADLSELPNIGPVLAKKIAEAGISDYETLASIGSVGVVLRIRGSVDPQACYNMLYALEGAIRGIRWHAIPREERQRLKEEFDRLSSEQI